MSEWRQITRGTYRALRRHAGVEVVIDELLEESSQLLAHSRKPTAQTGELEYQDEPDDRVIEQRSDARAVGENDISLQKGALLGRNTCLRQEAESRVDSI